MKKIALLLTLALTTYCSNAQQWPLNSGWPFNIVTGSHWNLASPGLVYGHMNYNYYNFLTNSMIGDVLNSTSNFYDAPPLDPNKYGGLNQRQYWNTYAQPLCTKLITETIDIFINDGIVSLEPGTDLIMKTLYQEENLNDRREAIAEIINLIKKQMDSKGIGMEMIESIFVTAAWSKPKNTAISSYKITYSYRIHVPCPSDYYTGGAQ